MTLRLILLLVFCRLPVLLCGMDPYLTQTHVPVEVAIRAELDVTAPDGLELHAAFTSPSGTIVRVPAFWAGGRLWKVRYSSGETGLHRYRMEADRPVAGLVGVEGAVEVQPYVGDNPLFRHGPVRSAANQRHLEHADRTPFFWLGDTWWRGLTDTLVWPHGFRVLAADRRAKGFTVVLLAAGLPSDVRVLDESEGWGVAERAAETVDGTRPDLFDQIDLRVQHLVEQGIVPCLVMPANQGKPTTRHRNWVARYGAYPVIWCLVDPAFNPLGDAAEKAEPPQVVELLGTKAVYRWLLGGHQQDEEDAAEERWSGLFGVGTGQTALSSLAVLADGLDRLVRARHRRPVVSMGGNYQGLFTEGNFGDQLQRHQFWVTLLGGGAGHTYGANGVWQLNWPGRDYGPAHQGRPWGNTPWPEAMHHLSSQQLGWSRQFLEESNWTELLPVPGGARFLRDEIPPFEETGATWIGPGTAVDGVVILGGAIRVPAEGGIRRAMLRIVSEAGYALSVNNAMIHQGQTPSDAPEGSAHHPAWEFPLLGEYLRPGRNLIRLRFDGASLTRARSVAVHVRVEMEDGTVVDAVSDLRWRWMRVPSEWPSEVLELDVHNGGHRVVAQSGNISVPAETAFSDSDSYGPRVARVPGQRWLVYLPASVPVEIDDLPDQELSLEVFNPADGQREPMVLVRPDASGRLRYHPSRGGDRVLQLRTLAPGQ